MAIADVVTGGFGTFSTVNKVPTYGFSIATGVDREITIYGRCLTTHAQGLNTDSTRTLEMSISGDADSVEYVFEETEVS